MQDAAWAIGLFGGIPAALIFLFWWIRGWGPDVTGNATQDEEGQNVDHIDRLELAGDTDRRAFMGELVEHVEHPILASVMGAVLDEVVGPDMIALLRAQRS